MYTEKIMQDMLGKLICDGNEVDAAWEDVEVTTYRDADICTCNKGLVINMPNGDQFQITIVQSWRVD